MSKIRSLGKKLGHPLIVFYILIWLMIVLVGGTIAQKYIGLYEAQHRFFSSFIMWIGPVPLPGGYLTLSILSLNLIAKLFFTSPWRKERIGTIISHFGVLLLLVGGLLTAYFSSEGSMTIYEGETSNYISDYHTRELVIFEDAGNGNENIVARYEWDQIIPGKKLTPDGLPISIEIIKACRNCDVFARKQEPGSPEFKELKSRAKDFDFKGIELDKNNELNKSGLSFRLKGAGGDQDGVYFSFDFIPVSPHVVIGGKTYNIMLRKEKRLLPFSIQLKNFHKEFHPSTDIAKSYRSDIIVKDGDTEWNSVIQMNEPLHYKGYILYQASFIDDNGKQATVLAVVKNLGRVFPYLSGGLMCIGLLIHLAMQLPKLISKRNAKANQ